MILQKNQAVKQQQNRTNGAAAAAAVKPDRRYCSAGISPYARGIQVVALKQEHNHIFLTVFSIHFRSFCLSCSSQKRSLLFFQLSSIHNVQLDWIAEGLNEIVEIKSLWQNAFLACVVPPDALLREMEQTRHVAASQFTSK